MQPVKTAAELYAGFIAEKEAAYRELAKPVAAFLNDLIAAYNLWLDAKALRCLCYPLMSYPSQLTRRRK